ncbi:PAS domain-containing protein [Sorangium sp. So ce1014]|uniref:hybrid sensor histidine kinase/response regulator n=1 Tax=Sorangium sp. So ce1014 TaxID=3133326 RepID=UPI003F614349
MNKASGQDHHLLFNLIPHLVWIGRPDGSIEHCNDNWVEYTGVDPAKGPGRGWCEAISPRDAHRTRAAWHHALTTGDLFEAVCRLRRGCDSSNRWFLTRARALRDAEGRVVRWIGTCTDIHDQKLIEKALRASEEHLTVALTAADMGTWRVEVATDIEHRGANLNRILGLRAVPSTQARHDFLARVHPDDRERLVRAVGQTLVGAVFDMELRFVRADGASRWGRYRGKVLADETSKGPLMTGVLVDITDLKLAEERAHDESRINETLYRLGASFARELDEPKLAQLIVDEATAVVDATCGAFFVVDDEALHRFRSHTFSGAEPNALASLPAQQITQLLAHMLHGSGVSRCDDTREDQRYGALGPEHAGHPSVVSFLIVSITNRSGDVIGILLFGHSEPARFTARHERIVRGIATQSSVALENARLYRAVVARETELAAAYAIAKAADRRKDEFLAMLGHELRNPLAPIATAVELMRLKGVVDLNKEREVIERQVKHLSRLVDDLLDISRLVRGKIEIASELLELGTVVTKAIEMTSSLLEKRAQRLAVDVPGQGLLVQGDPVRLVQVFQNLLTNAAKYTPPHGQLTLHGYREGNEIVVRMIDNGMGMSQAILGSVFEPFVQGDRALDRSEGGLGIGLSLVRRLVGLHGGTVLASSAGQGKGSEFVVRLPMAEADSADGQVRPAFATKAAAVPAAAPRRVLIVDDNADAAATLGGLLRHLGHHVVVAHNGPDALALLNSAQPDTALLDIGLPVMNGYDLARRMRERITADELLIVAISGYGQEHDRERSLAAGFDDHLVKPVETNRLLAVFELGRARGRDRARSSEIG